MSSAPELRTPRDSSKEGPEGLVQPEVDILEDLGVNGPQEFVLDLQLWEGILELPNICPILDSVRKEVIVEMPASLKCLTEQPFLGPRGIDAELVGEH